MIAYLLAAFVGLVLSVPLTYVSYLIWEWYDGRRNGP